jgi:hypothetical protein
MPDAPTHEHGSAWSDERIIEALASLREELLVPVEPLTVPATSRRPSSWRRPLLAAAAIVLVAVVVGATVAPARDAVADWLGIGSTEVRIVPQPSAPPPSLPALADGARPVTAAEAAVELGRPLPAIAHPSTAAVPEYAVPIEGGVLVRWPERSETLWVRVATDDSPMYFTKLVGSDAEIEPVAGVGENALWLGASHVLETPGRAVAAQNVLLWLDAGFELRLEGDLSRDEMVAIARGVG